MILYFMNNLGKKNIKFLLTNKTMIRNGDFITNRNIPDLSSMISIHEQISKKINCLQNTTYNDFLFISDMIVLFKDKIILKI